MIQFKCTKCGEDMEAPTELAETFLQCPACGLPEVVPGCLIAEMYNRFRQVIPLTVKREEIPFKRNLALIGAAILSFGVFLPITSIPIIGALTLFDYRTGDPFDYIGGHGKYILILAAITAAIALFKNYEWLWVTAVFSGYIIFYDLILTLKEIFDFKEEAISNLEGNLSDLIIAGLTYSIQLDYGWGVLIVGNLLIFLAAGYKSRLNKLFSSKQSAIYGV